MTMSGAKGMTASGAEGMSMSGAMIYLNNAATSWPKPQGVAAAVARALEALPGAANRGGIEDFDVMGALRLRLAEVMGIGDGSRVSLGSNATWGLNEALFGIGLGPGDTVVTTKAEHNSVLRPLHTLSHSRGVKVVSVDTDEVGRVPVEAWSRAIEEHRPRLAVFTHASNVTGAVNDAAALTAAAHSRGTLVLVDLAQTLGWCDVALEDWAVDMAAFTGHKYLLGPQGIGGVYVRAELGLDPHLVGGTGIRSDLDTMPEEMPLHLEAGTGNEPGAWGLLAALDWAATHPVSERRPAVLDELRSLATGLRKLGARVIDPGIPQTPVLSFTFEGITPHDIGEALLDSYDVIVRTGLHCAPRVFGCLGVDSGLGTVRASLSRFTTQRDCAALVEAMGDITSSAADWT
jgi:selenocysteine lyase/cysteine desulfurase